MSAQVFLPNTPLLPGGFLRRGPLELRQPQPPVLPFGLEHFSHQLNSSRLWSRGGVLPGGWGCGRGWGCWEGSEEGLEVPTRHKTGELLLRQGRD